MSTTCAICGRDVHDGNHAQFFDPAVSEVIQIDEWTYHVHNPKALCETCTARLAKCALTGVWAKNRDLGNTIYSYRDEYGVEQPLEYGGIPTHLLGNRVLNQIIAPNNWGFIRRLVLCCECGFLMPTYYWAQGRYGVCPHCADEAYPQPLRITRLEADEEVTSKSLHEYSYKPSPLFNSKRNKKKSRTAIHPKSTTPYYGLEIELDISDVFDKETIPDVLSSVPEVYCKEDGTIEHGAEVVTHPLTMMYWKTEMNNFFGCLQKLQDEYDANGRDNGIHIHINKTAFSSQLAQVKYQAFFHNFMDRYPVWFKLMVGRSPNSYCGKVTNTAAWRNIKTKKMGVCNNSDRYGALNFSNLSTVEVRSFVGSTYKNEILKDIEFCDSVLKHVKTQSLSTIESGVCLIKNYFDFLATHKHTYTNLITHIKEKSVGGELICAL